MHVAGGGAGSGRRPAEAGCCRVQGAATDGDRTLPVLLVCPHRGVFTAGNLALGGSWHAKDLLGTGSGNPVPVLGSQQQRERSALLGWRRPPPAGRLLCMEGDSTPAPRKPECQGAGIELGAALYPMGRSVKVRRTSHANPANPAPRVLSRSTRGPRSVKVRPHISCQPSAPHPCTQHTRLAPPTLQRSCSPRVFPLPWPLCGAVPLPHRPCSAIECNPNHLTPNVNPLFPSREKKRG